MEVVACRTCKINIVFTAAVAVRFPNNLYQMDFFSLLDNHLV